MSPYCVVGYFEEHVDGECSLTREKTDSEESELLSEPLGIMPEVSRTPKEDKLVSDVKSTGRKRAVQVKPIPKEGMLCEWAKLRFAGGGVFPIIGCLGNNATDIHHGPDKNTLNNTLDNLHRLCSTCHNRFHTLNDPTYPPENIGYEWLPLGQTRPHDPKTEATNEEILNNEIWWKTPKELRTSANT